MNENIRTMQLGLGLPADGIVGPITRSALVAAAEAGRLMVVKPVEKDVPRLINTPDAAALNAGSEEKLVGVHPALAEIIRETARRSAIPFVVIEGVRSPARQAQLVARGASKTQNSRHLTGHAADLWPVDPATGKALPAGSKSAEARLWADLRAIAATVKLVAKERGVLIEWGGEWGWDAPHLQLNRAAYPA